MMKQLLDGLPDPVRQDFNSLSEETQEDVLDASRCLAYEVVESAGNFLTKDVRKRVPALNKLFSALNEERDDIRGCISRVLIRNISKAKSGDELIQMTPPLETKVTFGKVEPRKSIGQEPEQESEQGPEAVSSPQPWVE